MSNFQFQMSNKCQNPNDKYILTLVIGTLLEICHLDFEIKYKFI
jgi:hypothetical protein